MSVLELPRLHFRGTAVTRLPTGPRSGLLDLATNQALTDDGPFPVDRPVAEYHAYLDRRGPRYDDAGRPDPDGAFSASKGWNFGGNGHFWVDARIVSAEGPAGPDVADPVVGRAVDMWGHYNEYLATTVNRARVFDVDPTSNWTTTIMVGQFGFGRDGRSHDTGYMLMGEVTGTAPPRWHNLEHIADVGEHVLAAQMRRSVVHQFVVTRDEGLSWLPESEVSPVTRLLRSAVDGAADGLVVQFALSNMAAPVVADTPDLWDVRGTVAPWRADELRTYPAGRLLTPPRGRRGGLHNLTVAVDAERATLNMITAVPVPRRAARAGPGPTPALGPRFDAGDLELRTARTDRLVATIPAAVYRGAGYDLTSGVVTVPAELPGSAVEDEALCLVGRVAAAAREVLLAEEEINLQVDDACVFLEHPDRVRGDDHAAEVAVRSFVRGRPAPVDTVYVRQFPNPRSRPLDPAATAARCGDIDIVQLHGGRREESGGWAPACTLGTDDHGRGCFTVRGARAGATRIQLTAHADDVPCDGSVPGSAAAAYDDEDALGYWAGAGSMAVRVLPDDWHLDGLTVQDASFELVYREVFAYYELLYSFMKAEVFSLADGCKARTYARLIWQMCDPRNKTKTYYMPPSRDMSEPKARLLLSFLRAQQAVTDIPVVVPSVRRTGGGITRRGELWAALKWAATVELTVMLQYLYAAYSIPTYGAGCEHVRRGLWTPEQLRLACGDGGETTAGGLRGDLLSIAREEMIHFLVVNNIIMAMGEPFHVPVVDFGTVNATLPIPMDFALEPLGLGSVQRFIAIERPEAEIGEIRRDPGPEVPAATEPARSWGSLSELYADIREGLQRVPDVFMVQKGRGGGEHHLFLRRSVNAVHPDYQLEVDDLSSALFAVDLVTEQGEGNKLTTVPSAGSSHYDMFLRISEALTAEQQAGTGRRRWSPAYPVPRNPTLHEGDPNTETVTDPQARAVMGLFNRSYFLMFQLMVQHFGQTPDASLRRSALMNTAIDVMTGMMSPLAELLVTMPSGRRGKTAGPSFELEGEPRFTARPDIAMQSVALRFQHLAEAARKCEAVPDRVTGMFSFYAEYVRDLAHRPAQENR
ncbi:ferritin-like domain-containing protein [Pseudonocardia acidicola]|uniref:VioB - polyketide synthase n=1 Tax=Pseudonocardia acidicola TaxID=2724939 RepID=A0ABX1SGG8_9PSEU|nr:ferritin-like domain-containing protein [Pseudonocardia acidicola]NMH99977.1 VioB - polyketide synthase [Pseudonocardia acidicola]